MKLFKTLLLAASFLIFSVVSVPAFLCFIPVENSLEKELKRASAVFSGKVAAIRRVKITDSTDKDFGAEVTTVVVQTDRWWKGSGEGEIILHTSIVEFPDGTRRQQSEDFSFETEQSYLFYVFRDDNKWRTNTCTRTKKLSEAGADLSELGTGFLPKTFPSPILR